MSNEILISVPSDIYPGMDCWLIWQTEFQSIFPTKVFVLQLICINLCFFVSTDGIWATVSERESFILCKIRSLIYGLLNYTNNMLFPCKPNQKPEEVSLNFFFCCCTSGIIYLTVFLIASNRSQLLLSKKRKPLERHQFSSVQFTQSCPTLCDPMDCSTFTPPCPSPTPRVYSNSCPLS